MGQELIVKATDVRVGDLIVEDLPEGGSAAYEVVEVHVQPEAVLVNLVGRGVARLSPDWDVTVVRVGGDSPVAGGAQTYRLPGGLVVRAELVTNPDEAREAFRRLT